MSAFLLFLALALTPQGEECPSFDDYLVEPVLDRAQAPLQQPPGSFARRYRTLLGEALSQPPNFAGKFSIVTWGAGTGLGEVAVLNLETGEAFRTPSLRFVSFPGNVEEGLDKDIGLEFHANSQLLIVNGAATEDGFVGSHFFVFDGRDFKLVCRRLWKTKDNVQHGASPSNNSLQRTAGLRPSAAELMIR